MNKLYDTQTLFTKYTEWGNNKDKAAKMAVNEAFSEEPIKPYIYTDHYEMPSHIFYGAMVLFFDGGIYKQM